VKVSPTGPSRLSMFMRCAEEHEIMYENESPKIDAVCVGLLALFLLGLAAYAVIIQFLK
jgi:hypothetical protein